MKRTFKRGEEVFVFNLLEEDLHGFGKIIEGISTDASDDIVLCTVNESGENEVTADRIYKLSKNRICSKCGCVVCNEHEAELKKTYPYWCQDCDENLFSIETTEVNKEEYQECLKDSKGRFLLPKTSIPRT